MGKIPFYITATSQSTCFKALLLKFAAPNVVNYNFMQQFSRPEMIEKVNHFMVNDFEVEASAIQPEANLKETLDLDSLDYVDLVVAIEQHFGLKVKPEDFQQLNLVSDFYNFIETRLQTQAAA